MAARFTTILSALLLAGCFDQPVSNDFGSTTPRRTRPVAANSTLADAVSPVRIGDLGPNFAACNAQGAVNERAADGAIPVRAAPFGEARQTGTLDGRATFFICTRSLDQHWFGVIYEAGGRAARSCGVSTPAPARREYRGPCESGWVASSQVRLISGVEAPADEPSGNIVQPK